MPKTSVTLKLPDDWKPPQLDPRMVRKALREHGRRLLDRPRSLRTRSIEFRRFPVLLIMVALLVLGGCCTRRPLAARTSSTSECRPVPCAVHVQPDPC